MININRPTNTRENRLRLALAMSLRQKAICLRESYEFLTHEDKNIMEVSKRAFKFDLREYLTAFLRYNEYTELVSKELKGKIEELIEDLELLNYYDTDKWKKFYEKNFNCFNEVIK